MASFNENVDTSPGKNSETNSVEPEKNEVTEQPDQGTDGSVSQLTEGAGRNSFIKSEKDEEKPINIYGHGFHNALYRISKEEDSFKDFLSSSVATEQLQQELSEVLSDLQKLHSEKRQKESDNIEIVQKISDLQGRQDYLLKKIADSQKKSALLEDQKYALIIKSENTKPEYSWMPAIFFFLAGIVFIAGDITITKQITSWGFDMAGGEAWIFAIGLAFTAFLIKPTIDRMFEKPFQKSGLVLQRVYKAFLFIIMGAGLLMLLFLGLFRSDSQIASQQFARNRASYKISTTADEKRKLDDEYKELNKQLNENGYGRWGIVLSGIIFAIGGGLCLSISFSSLTPLTSKYWFYPVRIKRLEKELQKQLDSENLLQYDVIAYKAEKSKYEAILGQFKLEDIVKAIETMDELKQSLRISYYKARTEQEIALYQDGFNRGEKYTIEGNLAYRIISSPEYVNGHEQKANSRKDIDGNSRMYTRRPFVKIRKMIADNYNKNNKNGTPDATEFEIVSEP